MPTPRQKIRELRAWRDEGLLTEEEFCQRKNAILDSAFAPGEQAGTTDEAVQQTDLGFLVGQEIGGTSKRYRLERLLGQGGMGQVWQATDLATHAELGHSDLVALKILPPQLTQSALHARLLIEEASLVRKLAHENIVRVYEWAQDPATSSYFIIMEYLDGQDLDSYLAAHGPRPLDQVLTLLEPVAQALHYAWGKHKLVHRDLKPGNLFLTHQGDIKLLDFGIAARLRSTTHLGKSSDVNATSETGAWPPARLPGAGTVGYRAPEARSQLQPQPSPNMDVYAVAVMMYQMLEGTMPFGEQRHPAHCPLHPAALSEAKWQVLQSGFAMAPERRPANVRALLDAMREAGCSHTAGEPRMTEPAARNSADERQIAQAEDATRQRAEQRRQRKALAEQRRQQASAALRVLIEKQRQVRELEEQRRRLERERQPAADSRVAPEQKKQAAPSPVHDSDALAHPQAPPRMSWEDAKRYLAWISRETGRPLLLPGESEWDNVGHGKTPKRPC